MTLIITKSKRKKVTHWLDSHLGISLFLREIKVSFFSTLVPNYVVLSYSIPSLKSWNLQRLSELSINFPPIVYAIIIIILTFIIPHLIQMHKQNQEKSLSKVLSNLLGGITVVVNDKSRRFHTVIHQNEHGDDKMSKDEIFTTITQPKEQIHSICTAIMTMFKDRLQVSYLKLLMVSYSENKFQNVVSSTSSDDTSTTIPTFLNNETMAKQCAIQKQMRIMECPGDDSYFYEDPDNKSKIKSMITYPICNEEGTKYVLCLSTHEEFTFKKKDEKIYEFILSEFGKRIILESYLHNLKNLSCTRRIKNKKITV